MKTNPEMFLQVCGGDKTLAEEVSRVANTGDMVSAMQIAQQGFIPSHSSEDEQEELTEEAHKEMVRSHRKFDQSRMDEITPAVRNWLEQRGTHPDLDGFDLLPVPDVDLFKATGKRVRIAENKKGRGLLISFKKDGVFTLSTESRGIAVHTKHDASLKGTRWA